MMTAEERLSRRLCQAELQRATAAMVWFGKFTLSGVLVGKALFPLTGFGVLFGQFWITRSGMPDHSTRAARWAATPRSRFTVRWRSVDASSWSRSTSWPE